MGPATRLLAPLPTLRMSRGKKAVPLQASNGKIAITLMKTTKNVGGYLAAGQPHEALANKPTKCCVQVVLSYDSSAGFN